MRFGASEAQLGLVDADDAEVGKEMQEESLLVFGCSSVKGLKVSAGVGEPGRRGGADGATGRWW